MKTIPLTKGFVAVVDDADFEAVSALKWHAAVGRKGLVYAARQVPKPVGGVLFLHQFLVGIKGVDHKDGDGLNNRRENLRPATLQQNNRGFKRKRAGASSKYRGVSFDSRDKIWKAAISVLGKDICLGRFRQEVSAANAYDNAAREHFGEFACLNFH